MNLVLDAGGVSALSGQRARLQELRRRGVLPAQVPAIVLTEALTGDHRRDFHANRLLETCQVWDVGEMQAREAARLRTATERAATISAVDAVDAVDAVVVAFAGELQDAVVLTGDPNDLSALAEHAALPVSIVGV
jgi:hypothetical protein